VGLLFGLWAGSAHAQTRVVTGQVTDAVTDAPLEGVGVSVAGTTISARTRADGSFNIGVPVGEVRLLFRHIGYKRAVATLSGGVSTLNVSLEADVFKLDEVVVTGRATEISRRNLANAVATLSGEEVAQVAAQSIEHALQGKVAGADVYTNSGAPGGGAQVQLRGVSTISGASSPLYVVDGVIISNEAVSSNTNAVTRASAGSNASTQDGPVNRVVDLNPNDIESIEILKGASASAIYGSKAPNGVVIIQTKRGREGRPRVNVTQRFGFFDLSEKLGFRTFEDAAEVDAWGGAGTAAAVGFTPGQTFDHEQALAGRNALSYETQLSASGGSENTTYFASALEERRRDHAEHRVPETVDPGERRSAVLRPVSGQHQHQRPAHLGAAGTDQQRQRGRKPIHGPRVHAEHRRPAPAPRRHVPGQPVRAQQPAGNDCADEERRGRVAVHRIVAPGIRRDSDRQPQPTVVGPGRRRLLRAEERSVLPAGPAI
jgi:TonB-dependent SusC/RagA subfamily outer membrane receptor